MVFENMLHHFRHLISNAGKEVGVSSLSLKKNFNESFNTWEEKPFALAFFTSNILTIITLAKKKDSMDAYLLFTLFLSTVFCLNLVLLKNGCFVTEKCLQQSSAKVSENFRF